MLKEVCQALLVFILIHATIRKTVISIVWRVTAAVFPVVVILSSEMVHLPRFFLVSSPGMPRCYQSTNDNDIFLTKPW